MSGHGGGGYGGGGGVGDEVDCVSIFFTTYLNSPDPVVLSTLEAKDVLDLRRPDSERPRIEAVTANGKIAGSVTGGKHAELIACMGQGLKYIALVLSVSGGRCEVEVRPKE